MPITNNHIKISTHYTFASTRKKAAHVERKQKILGDAVATNPMLWQRTHSPAKNLSNRFLTKVQHNFETAPHQTKFRCQQSRGCSQSEEASANPLRDWTGKMCRKEEGKAGQNLKGKMAKAVFTNTSGNVVRNTAHQFVLVC
jgi:hypothetical protein